MPVYPGALIRDVILFNPLGLNCLVKGLIELRFLSISVRSRFRELDRIPDQPDAASFAAAPFEPAFLDKAIPNLPINFNSEVLV